MPALKYDYPSILDRLASPVQGVCPVCLGHADPTEIYCQAPGRDKCYQAARRARSIGSAVGDMPRRDERESAVLMREILWYEERVQKILENLAHGKQQIEERKHRLLAVLAAENAATAS